MAGHAGIKSRFILDGEDISRWLTGVDGSSDTEFLDATTFQPDATPPIKEEIPGFSSKSKSLSGMWI
jgi:hypothetical protein